MNGVLGPYAAGDFDSFAPAAEVSETSNSDTSNEITRWRLKIIRVDCSKGNGFSAPFLPRTNHHGYSRI